MGFVSQGLSCGHHSTPGGTPSPPGQEGEGSAPVLCSWSLQEQGDLRECRRNQQSQVLMSIPQGALKEKLHRDQAGLQWPTGSQQLQGPREICTEPPEWPHCRAQGKDDLCDTTVPCSWQGAVPQPLTATAPWHCHVRVPAVT